MDSLLEITSLLKQSGLKTLFNSLEEHRSGATSYNFDLLLNSVWQPISKFLIEKHANMFNIGITRVFSRCYVAIRLFLEELSSLVLPLYRTKVHARLEGSKITQTFWCQWKFDLYHQLRVRELTFRIDSICEQSLNRVQMKNLDPYTYLISGTSTSETSTTSNNSNSADLHMEPISVKRIRSIFREFQASLSFMNPFFEAFLVELLILSDPNVSIDPLLSKFILLADRMVLRLLLHLSHLTNDALLASAALNLTKGEFETSRALSLNRGLPTGAESQAGHVLNLDERILITDDLLKFSKWFDLNFSSLWFGNSRESARSQLCIERVNFSIKLVVRKLEIFTHILFRQIVQDIILECVKPLQVGIKAIAGKYRMTNKPPPSTASPYVASIFTFFK